MKYELFMICPPWKQYRDYKRSNKILTDSIPPKMWRALRAFNFIETCLAELAFQEHVIMVWVTDKFTEECREYMGRLGYQYDTCLIWKRAKWKRGSTNEVFEYLMVFSKGRLQGARNCFSRPITITVYGQSKMPEPKTRRRLHHDRNIISYTGQGTDLRKLHTAGLGRFSTQ